MYLLSYEDIYNSGYGFNNDESRYAKVTDYAKANGAYWSISTRYIDNGYYWLRSPYYDVSNRTNCVNHNGFVDDNRVSSTNYGVRVACNINLK